MAHQEGTGSCAKGHRFPAAFLLDGGKPSIDPKTCPVCGAMAESFISRKAEPLPADLPPGPAQAQETLKKLAAEQPSRLRTPGWFDAILTILLFVAAAWFITMLHVATH